MIEMYGLYRGRGLNREELVIYGNGDVDFVTTRKSYEAAGFTPRYEDLPWKESLEELMPG
ncbi:hypothetical protein OVA03_04390 [Asticcacaulis sp. SL142]|jgi:hypothetical protein|uniref:hypothetical protein n=1 Tax=Asticcacaulis sp. SL142 TaxID=2995155 RepID=UPI00226C6C27|nr:hypothetical protein [Asticcacaulis sp. SL142]WAC49160.1 hypothetical protein OVA03_04390 [Asticcacaulis sp. SL142]